MGKPEKVWVEWADLWPVYRWPALLAAVMVFYYPPITTYFPTFWRVAAFVLLVVIAVIRIRGGENVPSWGFPDARNRSGIERLSRNVSLFAIGMLAWYRWGMRQIWGVESIPLGKTLVIVTTVLVIAIAGKLFWDAVKLLKLVRAAKAEWKANQGSADA